ncbi:MAG TPA: MBL fold metallo-hydrolase [Pseudonocardiaceae bacterium]|jgi:L-ascorbate metabolism protein UlaG (beta-lactamase superfamily)
MRLTHYGHACVLVEIPRRETAKRVLIDPGTYSRDFEDLHDLDLILITHAHPDHLDADRLRVVAQNNPDATIVRSPGAATALTGLTTTVTEPGDTLVLNDIEIAVTGSGAHARIHPDLPGSDNNGYLIEGAVLHPGDALDPPGVAVDTLLVPAGGPWLKLAESIDYLRAVAPRVAVPIHQAGLAPAHQRMHHQLLTDLAPGGTEVVILEHAIPKEIQCTTPGSW